MAYSARRLETAKAVRTATTAHILTEVKDAIAAVNALCEQRLATDWDDCRATTEELIARTREIIGGNHTNLAIVTVQRTHLPGDELLALQAPDDFTPEYCCSAYEAPASPSLPTVLAEAVSEIIGEPTEDELNDEIDRYFAEGGTVAEKGGLAADAPTEKKPTPPTAELAPPSAAPAPPSATSAPPTAAPAP
eukprot:SAG11_NODE_7083_length_1196_cov_8.770283_1_plen_191_part_10